jgi:hypothetical protein
VLLWDPPEFSNGVLLFYKVWANSECLTINEAEYTVEIDNSNVTKVNYTLNGLLPYTQYDIAVQACTKECSVAAQFQINTTVGRPGNFSGQPQIEIHNLLYTNYTSANIQWDPPLFKGGNLDYYEFKTKLTSRDGRVAEHIIKTTRKDCFIEQLCTSEAMFYDFSVRAVNYMRTGHVPKDQILEIKGSMQRHSCNSDDEVLLGHLTDLKAIDPHGLFLPGSWSPPIGHSCHYGAFESKQYIMLMVMMIASLVIVVMVFYSYRKIKDMKDILVQMPPGLEDLTGDKMKKGKDLGGIHLRPDILHNVDNISINCEDENGQLLKKSLNGSLIGGDCSSSIRSESTRSEDDHIEPADQIEYDEFDRRNSSTNRDSNDDLKVKFT